ncbi:M14 family zinc carboxypeptidase [Gemmatimonadota bacterium]
MLRSRAMTSEQRMYRTDNLILRAIIAAMVIAWPLRAEAQGPERVAMISINTPTRTELDRISRLGLEVQMSPFGGDGVVFADQRELDALRAAGITFQISHEDAEAWFASRLDASLGPGSMGGYYTLAEVLAKMDEFSATWPDIISPRFSVGTSLEGRDIWAFIVSDAPVPGSPDLSRPAVFYNALTHAREPIGVMQLLAFVEDIAAGWARSDPTILSLLGSRELWFVPVVNPDGYYFNEVWRPGGGGMWRKNKRDNDLDGTFDPYVDGVDLNRNFGYHWGEDNTGSSPNPGSEVYRGTNSFSEPETRAVREVFDLRPFQFCLNYHAYSNVYLYPWDFTSTPADSLAAFQRWLSRLSAFNHFAYGTGPGLIGYNTNGGAVDWQYGDRGVMAVVPEVGTWFDYFWPPTLRIPTLVREQIGPNHLTAWMAGGVLLPDDVERIEVGGNGNGWIDPDETAEVTVTWTNAGISQPVTGATATLTALGPDATVLDGTSQIGDLAVGESREVTDTFRIRADAVPRGRRMEFALRVDAANGYTRIDTIGVMVGEPVLLVQEDAEHGLSNWNISGGFALTGIEPFAGSYSISDAPYGQATRGENLITLQAPIDLREYHGAALRFMSRQLVGPENIAAIVVSTDPFVSPLPPDRTTAADPAIYYTTGNREGWEEIKVDLTPFTGTDQLWLGWFTGYRNVSDLQGGWSIDNIRVEAWSSTTGNSDVGTRSISLGAPWPNPSNPSASRPLFIRADLSDLGSGWSSVTLTVFDARGRHVVTLLDGSLENRFYEQLPGWDGYDDQGRRVPSGIYLMELRAGGARSTRKLLILR